MVQSYIDRFGEPHIPQMGDIVRPRAGAFILCLYQDHILTLCPAYAPETYELPGGGIDAGEDAITAAMREWQEETGLPPILKGIAPEQSYQQDVYFYAEDVDEYWHYHQIFFIYRGDFSEIFFPEEARPTPEQGKMQWLPLKNAQNTPKFHHMHAKALQYFHDK